jgi:hypothetical protein
LTTRNNVLVDASVIVERIGPFQAADLCDVYFKAKKECECQDDV